MSTYETTELSCLTDALLHVRQARKQLSEMPGNLAEHEVMELTETIRTLSELAEDIKTGEHHSW